MPIHKIELPNGKFVKITAPEGADPNAIVQFAAKQWEASDDFEHDFNAWNMVKNAPGSVAKQFGDIYDAVTNPSDTLGAIRDVGIGAASHAFGLDRPEEEMASKVADSYANTYGNWDRFQKKLENDPASIAGDASMALGGAGLATKVGTAGKLGQTMSKAGAAIDPINMTLNTVKQIPRAIAGNNRARDLYASATGLPAAEAEELLRQRILPSERGMEQLRERGDELITQRDAIIQDIPGTTPASVLMGEAWKRRASTDVPSNPNRRTETAALDRALATQERDLGFERPTFDPDTGRKLMPLRNEPKTPQDLQGIRESLVGPRYLEAKDKGQDRLIGEPNSAVRGKMNFDIALKAQNILEQAAADLGIPDMPDLNKAIAQYQSMIPGLAKGVKRAQDAAGNLSSDVVLPSGVAYGITQMGGGPILGTIGGVMALGLNRINNPKQRAQVARYLSDTRNQKALGFTTNKETLQALQAIIRESGEYPDL